MCCECNGGSISGPSTLEKDICEDTDNGMTNSRNNTCQYYWGNEKDCTMLNDKEFDASIMCCACGGGKTSKGVFNSNN